MTDVGEIAKRPATTMESPSFNFGLGVKRLPLAD